MSTQQMIMGRWSSVVPSIFVVLGLAAATLACGVDPATDGATAVTEPTATAAPATITEPSVEPTIIAEAPAEPATIMLALDVSLSMLAEDTEPNRISGARAALNAFLDEAPAGTYIGLVSFHGIATVDVLPTTDRAAVRSVIENVELDEATAIGEAIFESIDSLESFVADHEGDAPPGRIVVLSDGETTVGRPDAAAIGEAQRTGIAVTTVVFGTDAGAILVPDSDLPVPVPINGASLAEIASETGGEHFEATTTDALVEIFTAMAQRLAE